MELFELIYNIIYNYMMLPHRTDYLRVSASRLSSDICFFNYISYDRKVFEKEYSDTLTVETHPTV